MPYCVTMRESVDWNSIRRRRNCWDEIDEGKLQAVNIVCIIHSLDGGGAERVMAALASRLVAKHHSVTLVTLDDGTVERHEVDRRVQRQRLDVMGESHGVVEKILNTRRRVAKIREAIRQQDADVVLSFCDQTNILAAMAASRLGVPIVLSERSDPSQQRLSKAWEILRRRSYAKAQRIIALTEPSAAYLRQLVSVPVTVVASAVDKPPLESERESAIVNRRILGVGRLEHEKGFDRLIDAFAKIATVHQGWTLRILGEGSARASLQSQITKLQLTDRVTMPGWVRPVWNELAEATLFALPSRYEGFPSALLEAMVCGVPSVAVDCPSGPRVVINDDACGLLVDDNVNALSSGIDRLISQPDYREQLGQAGKNVETRFGWDAMVDAYEQVLIESAGARKQH